MNAKRARALAKVFKAVQEFVTDGPRDGRGSWAPVEPQDIVQLYGIVEALIALKQVPDADGDLSLRCTLVDRTKTRNLDYIPLPYYHVREVGEQDADKLLEDAMDTAIFNLSLATQDVQLLADIKRRQRQYKEKEKENQS